MTEQIDAIIEYTPICVKINTKLTVLSNSHELNSIAVNKGQIHRELR